jgi:hypothetical protein
MDCDDLLFAGGKPNQQAEYTHRKATTKQTKEAHDHRLHPQTTIKRIKPWHISVKGINGKKPTADVEAEILRTAKLCEKMNGFRR